MNTMTEVKNRYAREFAGSTPWGDNFLKSSSLFYKKSVTPLKKYSFPARARNANSVREPLRLKAWDNKYK